MPQEKIYELESDDYSQSANTLFHFMKESRFLNDILIKKPSSPGTAKKISLILKSKTMVFPLMKFLSCKNVSVIFLFTNLRKNSI